MPTSKPAIEAYVLGRADSDRGRPPRNIATVTAQIGPGINVLYWYQRGYEE